MSKDKEVDRCLRSIVDLVSDASKIHCTSVSTYPWRELSLIFVFYERLIILVQPHQKSYDF